MTILNGISVSPGIAIGTALINYKEKIQISHKTIKKDAVNPEIRRFKYAVCKEIRELQSLIDNFAEEEEKKLLNSHKMILQDPILFEKISSYIKDKQFSAEYSLHRFYIELSKTFAKMTNSYFAERISDYEDIILKLINRLNGNGSKIQEDISAYPENEDIILILENISPSDVAKTFHTNVSGICLTKGSKTSHTAIIARSLGIPVIVGVTELTNIANNKDKVILDGNEGKVILRPDKKTLARYEKELADEQLSLQELDELISLPILTADKKKIQLLCNIEIEQEVDTVIRKNADGVGLFRTEYLFVDRDSLPTEDEQYHIYHKIASKLKNKTLVIRTYDLGGDKLAKSISSEQEDNPFLGCRGIRLSLRYPDIFKTQIKATLRANEHNNIALMFPMVTSAYEVEEAISIVAECKKELNAANVPFNGDISIGAMIEVPAAVFSIAQLSQVCDFFSIGTNDLVQYTLAADRNNKSVNEYYDPYHPAVIKLIAMTLIGAHRYGKPVSICGEVASERDYITMMIGLGIDSLSVNPSSLLLVKKHLSNIDSSLAEKTMKKVIRASSADEIKEILKKANHQK